MKGECRRFPSEAEIIRAVLNKYTTAYSNMSDYDMAARIIDDKIKEYGREQTCQNCRYFKEG